MVSLTSQLIAFRKLAVADQNRSLLAQRLATGVNVADRRDSTGAVSRSRTLTNATASLGDVLTSLNTGIATVSAAKSGIAAASRTLSEMRAVLVAAKQLDADPSQLQSRFTALNSQLRANAAGAAFGGINLLASSSVTSYVAAPKDGAGQTYAIGPDLNQTRLLDTLGTTGLLQKTFDLSSITIGGGSSGAAPSTLGLSGSTTPTDGVAGVAAPGMNGLSGTASSVAGQAVNAVAPATTGLSGAANTVAGTAGTAPSSNGLSGTAATVGGAAARSATTAVASVGTYNATMGSIGDTLKFDVTLTLDGVATTKALQLYQRNVTDRGTMQTELQSALNTAFGTGKVTATVDASNRISLTTAATGSNQGINVANVRFTDGDDRTSSTLALQTRTDYNTTDTITIGGQAYYRDRIGVPNFTNIDKGDTLNFVVRGAYDKGEGSSGTKAISVKLSAVTGSTQAEMTTSLAAAINAQLTQGASSDLFGATTQDGQVVIYHKKNDRNSVVRVETITAQNGNGTAGADDLGLVAGTATGTAAESSVAASATTGSDFASPMTLENGAALKFDIKVNAGVTQTITINETTVKAALNSASGTIASISQLVTVATKALADAGVTGVAVAAEGNRLKFTKSGTPADNDSVTVSNVQTIASTATQATLTTGSDFAGPRMIAENARIDFTLTVGGSARTISVTKADVETALSGVAGRTAGSGTIANVTQFANVVQAAMTRQGLTTVTVAADGTKLKFSKTAAGAETLAISSVASSSTATSARATSGSDFDGAITLNEGTAITFDIALDGGTAQTIRLDKATTESVLSGRNTINSAAELASVAQRALSNASVSGITVATNGNRLTFTRTASGAGSVALANTQTTGRVATNATLRTGSDFAGPVTLDPSSSIGFDVALDGGAATHVTVQRSTVEAALGAGRYTIDNVGEFAQVVQQALTEASVSGVGVTAIGNRIELRKTSAGTGQIVLDNVGSVATSGSGGGSTTPDATTLDGINLAGGSFMAMSQTDRNAVLDGYIRNLDMIAKSVAEAGSHLGRVASQLDVQSQHTTRLQTIQTSRLNGSVKTDIDEATARKTALEVQLALAKKSLAIISESRKNVLNILKPFD